MRAWPHAVKAACRLRSCKALRGAPCGAQWLSNFDLCENCINKPEADEKAPYAAVDITTKRGASKCRVPHA